MQVAADVVRNPSVRRQAPAERHAWVDAERHRLGLDAAVGEWKDKPLKYHAKARPQCFVRMMHRMSSEREAAGGRAFALYPLRRSYVPLHVRFDQKALRELLKLGTSEHMKQQAKTKRQKTKVTAEPDGAGYESPVEAAGRTSSKGGTSSTSSTIRGRSQRWSRATPRRSTRA